FPRNPPAAIASTGTSSVDALTRAKTWARQTWDSVRAASLVVGAVFGAPPDPSVSTAPGARPASKDQRVLNVTSFEWTILREYPRVEELDEAFPLFGRYVSDIRRTSNGVGAPVLLVVIPQIAQVVPSERARTATEYRFSDDEVDWQRPQREVQA